MKVFLTGGSGFVGSHILTTLVQKGHSVKVLTRSESTRAGIHRRGGEVVIGNVNEPGPWEDQLNDCETIINLIGIIRETPTATFEQSHYQATIQLLSLAETKGIKRFLQMSALGTREGAASMYFQTKFRGEEAVRQSHLPYLIFRPSIIFGPGDGFVNMLADLIRKAPLVPVVGSGEYKMQPVSIHNVAKCFAIGLEKKEVLNQTFEIGGPSVLTYNTILDEIMDALGTHKGKIHLPVTLMKPVASLMELILVNPLITTEQMNMLLEDNVCDNGRVIEAFELDLIPFSKGIREYLKTER